MKRDKAAYQARNMDLIIFWLENKGDENEVRYQNILALKPDQLEIILTKIKLQYEGI